MRHYEFQELHESTRGQFIIWIYYTSQLRYVSIPWNYCYILNYIHFIIIHFNIMHLKDWNNYAKLNCKLNAVYHRDSSLSKYYVEFEIILCNLNFFVCCFLCFIKTSLFHFVQENKIIMHTTVQLCGCFISYKLFKGAQTEQMEFNEWFVDFCECFYLKILKDNTCKLNIQLTFFLCKRTLHHRNSIYSVYIY